MTCNSFSVDTGIEETRRVSDESISDIAGLLLSCKFHLFLYYLKKFKNR